MGNKGTSTRSAAAQPAALSILTFNIWFEGGWRKPDRPTAGAAAVSSSRRPTPQLDDTNNFALRIAGVLDCVRSADADVVCLQELTHWSMEIFRDALTATHHVSHWGEQGAYGVAMFVKKTLVSDATPFTLHRIPTGMGRFLLSTVVHGVLVCTCHFESLAQAPTRKQQLEAYARLAESMPGSPCVLCGDFNFCSYRNYSGQGTLENLVLGEVLPDHTDIWPRLHPQPLREPTASPDRHQTWRGYTFDNLRNVNIRQSERMRYDRVLLREGCGLVAQAIELVGTDKILDIEMHPSDHFGLLAQFEPTTRTPTITPQLCAASASS